MLVATSKAFTIDRRPVARSDLKHLVLVIINMIAEPE
jgi:hypothetical protein